MEDMNPASLMANGSDIGDLLPKGLVFYSFDHWVHFVGDHNWIIPAVISYLFIGLYVSVVVTRRLYAQDKGARPTLSEGSFSPLLLVCAALTWVAYALYLYCLTR